MNLRDPETCPHPLCGGPTRVRDKRNRGGIIRRWHVCLRCGRRWKSWQSLIDPQDVSPDDIDPSALAKTQPVVSDR